MTCVDLCWQSWSHCTEWCCPRPHTSPKSSAPFTLSVSLWKCTQLMLLMLLMSWSSCDKGQTKSLFNESVFNSSLWLREWSQLQIATMKLGHVQCPPYKTRAFVSTSPLSHCSQCLGVSFITVAYRLTPSNSEPCVRTFMSRGKLATQTVKYLSV